MAEAVCPLCRSEKNHRCFSENNYHVLACEHCELLFIHPYPRSVDEVHRRVVTHDSEDRQVLNPDRQYRGELLLAERSWPMIQEECRGGESVLDVGCGCGRLLELLGSIPGLYRAGIELAVGLLVRIRWSFNDLAIFDPEVFHLAIDSMARFSYSFGFFLRNALAFLSGIPWGT